MYTEAMDFFRTVQKADVATLALGLCLLGLMALPLVTRGANPTIRESSTFTQNLYVNGSVSKGSGSFVIDHPLDPKNKLLYHSFVESPDMKNIYDGIAIFDEEGKVTVELPSYFSALNTDFRYLATPIGMSMPDLYVEKEVSTGIFGLRNARFTLAGGIPGGRVSWQVTGIRHDKVAQEFPIIPEVNKADSLLVKPGEFLLPEYYGGE
jgi:hypothetical protein